MSARLSLRAAGGSHTGLIRDQNEDRLIVDAARGVFCVVDGVGGHPGGERAAAIAVEMIEARLARESGTPAERLREAITLANNAILEEAAKDETLAGMTCVLTAAIVGNGQLTVGHVGDSRLYKLHAGAIRKLTHDHSPVGEREDAGELTEAEAMQHPRRNEVYRDVGTEPHTPEDDHFVEIVETTFEADAALVLCSDGLSDQVASAAIRRAVDAHANTPEAAVEHLIRAANDAGGKDNVTVIVVQGETFGGAATTMRPNGAGAMPARAGGRTSGWVWLVIGVSIGLGAAALAVWQWRPDVLRSAVPEVNVTPAPAVDPSPRRWTVGLTGGADAATIAEAMSRVQAGDTIVLSPGDYREQVVMKSGVLIEGPRTAVVRPPLGAAADWVAVDVAEATGVRLSGFSIAAAEGQPLATAVRVRRGDVDLVDVEVSGATDTAVLVAEGGAARVRACVLRDNAGSAIHAHDGTRLQVSHSLIVRNGTSAARLHPGIQLGTGVTASLVGNAIGDNGGAAVAGWPPADLPSLLRDNLVRPAPRVPRPAPARAPRP